MFERPRDKRRKLRKEQRALRKILKKEPQKTETIQFGSVEFYRFIYKR